MTCDLVALCFAAADPARLARFWGGLLGWEQAGDRRSDVVALVPDDDTGFRIRFTPTDAEKVGLNRMHLDLTSSSEQDQQATVRRALALGGRHLDVGQLPGERHVVLADPEGNELCVIEPGNRFLAGCGLVGALACDGTQGVGYFWSKALDWPLVWDQEEETAIRSPHGGPKVTWGGPPLARKRGPNRLRFELVPTRGAQTQAEVDRLAALGAHVVGVDADDPGVVLLVDPDDNEFSVVERGTRR